MSRSIFHITSAAEAEEAAKRGIYVPAGFERDGFIHCSYADQVVGVASFLYRNAPPLVLLEVDPARLDCPLVEENLDGGEKLFPHVYGPLPMAAVVRVHEFPTQADGFFELPESVGA